MKKFLAILSLASILACSGGGTPQTETKPPVIVPVIVPGTVGIFRTLKATPAPIQGLQATSSNETVLMSTRRSGHKGLLLKDGRVLLVGGEHNSDATDTQTTYSWGDIFDPVTERFTRTTSLIFKFNDSTAAKSFDMVLLPDGKVLLAGGVDQRVDGYLGNKSLILFNPYADTATEIPNVFPDFITGIEHTFYIGNNKVLITGPVNVTDYRLYSYALIYDIVTRTSLVIPHDFSYMFSGVSEDSTGIYFFGGTDKIAGNYTSNSDIVRFNRTNYSFTKISHLTQSKFSFGVVALGNGEFGIYGGLSSTTEQGEPARLKEVEVFRTATMACQVMTPLPSAVSDLKSVPLQGTSYTLHAGGTDEDGFVESNEYVHNMITNVAGSTGTLVEPRRQHSVIALNNGLVLISGGAGATSNSTKDSAEIYDVQSKLFINFTTDQITAGDTCQLTTTKDVTWTLAPEGTVAPAMLGTIDTTGLYTSNPLAPTIIVRATATLKSDTTVSATIRIKVFAKPI